MKTASVIISVAILEVAVALTLIPLVTPARLKTTDFVNFYIGASIVRNGRGAELYRRETQDAAYRSSLGYASNQYFLHPPFEAAALAPLALMSMEHAFAAWMLVNVAFLGCLPLLLMPCVPLIERRPYMALLGFTFLPALIALNLGQDSLVLLFILSASYLLLSKGKHFAAGLVLALLAIKFQYLAVLTPMLLFSRRFRMLAGVSAGCGFLAVVSLLITGPRGLMEYFAFVRDFDAQGGYGGLNPALMVNARGFLVGLGYAAGAKYSWIIASALFAGTGFYLGRKQRGESSELHFAFFLTGGLIASPYAHFPDATLLLLPMILAVDRIVAEEVQHRKLITTACVALFLSPYLLLLRGHHRWWEGPVYLLFVVIAVFAASLAVEISGLRINN